MFKVNDTIIYGSEGVCQIIGIEEKNFGGAVRSYYIVKPLYSNSSTIFIPLYSEILTAKMHRMLSREEIEELIDSLPNETIEWIPNDRERKNAYRKIIASGDRTELLKAIRGIYLEKKRREALHKNLHLIDEHFLRDAEQCLWGEFQHVLGIGQDEVIPYIVNRIENKALK